MSELCERVEGTFEQASLRSWAGFDNVDELLKLADKNKRAKAEKESKQKDVLEPMSTPTTDPRYMDVPNACLLIGTLTVLSSCTKDLNLGETRTAMLKRAEKGMRKAPYMSIHVNVEKWMKSLLTVESKS